MIYLLVETIALLSFCYLGYYEALLACLLIMGIVRGLVARSVLVNTTIKVKSSALLFLSGYGTIHFSILTFGLTLIDRLPAWGLGLVYLVSYLSMLVVLTIKVNERG